jgi:hypothetical protein
VMSIVIQCPAASWSRPADFARRDKGLISALGE